MATRDDHDDERGYVLACWNACFAGLCRSTVGGNPSGSPRNPSSQRSPPMDDCDPLPLRLINSRPAMPVLCLCYACAGFTAKARAGSRDIAHPLHRLLRLLLQPPQAILHPPRTRRMQRNMRGLTTLRVHPPRPVIPRQFRICRIAWAAAAYGSAPAT